MILRPLDPIPATSTDFLPAWSVVEQSQRQIRRQMLDDHAALSRRAGWRICRTDDRRKPA